MQKKKQRVKYFWLGQIIELMPERLVIYDVGKKEFDNYIMERYIVENPEYTLESGEEARRFGREDTFYTFADKDKLVFASFTIGSFLLERCEEKALESLPEWEAFQRFVCYLR